MQFHPKSQKTKIIFIAFLLSSVLLFTSFICLFNGILLTQGLSPAIFPFSLYTFGLNGGSSTYSAYKQLGIVYGEGEGVIFVVYVCSVHTLSYTHTHLI